MVKSNHSMAFRLGVCLLAFPAVVCAATPIPTIAPLCNTPFNDFILQHQFQLEYQIHMAAIKAAYPSSQALDAVYSTDRTKRTILQNYACTATTSSNTLSHILAVRQSPTAGLMIITSSCGTSCPWHPSDLPSCRHPCRRRWLACRARRAL